MATGYEAGYVFKLYAGNNIYEGGENGTQLGFFATSSVSTNEVPWDTSTFSYFPSIANSSFGKMFSGSYQEIRYFDTLLDSNVFKDYIMNPSSIEGLGGINSSPNELVFRASLGGELYTGSRSIHPKVTGSWVPTSSFATNSDFYISNTSSFVTNEEYFFFDQPVAGIKNAISDKIRLENSIIPTGSVLSPFRSLAQNLAASQSYTANTNLLEVAFSPQDEINDDISSQIGYFEIGELIGDPRLRSSSATSYPDLDALRNEYFEKYTKNYDLNDYIRLIKFFDNSLFKMIKDFVPARTSLASGVVIKQHLLERNKYPQPQTTIDSTIAYYGSGSQNNLPFVFQNIEVSGTVAPQWNDYQPGTIENFSGGTGGTFEPFNGINTSPYGPNGTGPENIFGITQSWNEGIITPLGIANTIHSSQDEFYDGEFSGSALIVTTQSLAQSLPLDLTSLSYHSSGSTSTTPSPGSFTWQTSLAPSGPVGAFFFIPSLYINEVDINGNNIETALSNLGPGDTITFTITGSVADGVPPPTPVYTAYSKYTLTGVISSVVISSPSVWRINFQTGATSTFMNSTAFYYPVNVGQDVNTPGNKSNTNILLNPFLNSVPNFYNSDYNPLINNVLVDRLSTIYQDVDYSTGITTPTNFNLLISGSAIKAAVQDSNYTSKRVTLPRYEGVKSTSQYLNQWTPGDTGTYGKLPTIDSLKTMVAYCDDIGGWPPERENASAAFVKYLIKSDGTVVIPNTTPNSLEDNKGTFETGENVLIQYQGTGNQVTPVRKVIRGGTRIEPILYTQYGQAPGTTWNTTMSFEDIVPSAVGVNGDYSAIFKRNTQQQITTQNNPTKILFTTATQGNSYFVSNGYQVPLNAVQDGVDLIFNPIINIKGQKDPNAGSQVLSNNFTFNVTIKLYKGTQLIYTSNTISLTTPPAQNSIDGVISFSSPVTISSANLNTGNQYFVYLEWNSNYPSDSFFYITPNSTFNIQQYPAYTLPVTSSGVNSIWGWPDKTNYPYVITSSQSTLTSLYGDPNVKMTNITGSGFNPVVLPWSIEYADEFKFEGNETYVYQVGKVFAPADSGSGRLTQTGSIEVHFNAPLPISASNFNLDHFAIRRYVDDASQILIEGFKPLNSSGPYIIRPEYVTPELDKGVDDFVLILKEKGLI